MAEEFDSKPDSKFWTPSLDLSIKLTISRKHDRKDSMSKFFCGQIGKKPETGLHVFISPYWYGMVWILFSKFRQKKCK